MALAGAILAVVAAVTLSACSSSPNKSAGGTTTTTAARGTTTTAGGNGTTSSTTSTSTTTSAPASTTCQASQLSLSAQLGNGAAGQIEQNISMRNTSSTSCTLSGYPGMQLYDSSQNPIPTNVVRGMQNFGTPAANSPAELVTLLPGALASFTVHYSDVPVGNETSCPTSASAHVTPPNDTTSATVSLQIAPCNGGTVHVSPVYAG
jgi:hypothetical protein